MRKISDLIMMTKVHGLVYLYPKSRSMVPSIVSIYRNFSPLARYLESRARLIGLSYVPLLDCSHLTTYSAFEVLMIL